MIENREHPRADVEIEMTYRSLDTIHRNTVLNISQGGIYIRTDSPLPLGTEISLEFTLPDADKVIQVKGVVVWRHEPTASKISSYSPGMGIKFRELKKLDLKLIKDYVNYLLVMHGEGDPMSPSPELPSP